MKIYAIRCNNNEPRGYCANKKLAIDALNIMKRDIQSRVSEIYNETEDSFSFCFGWMETGGTWRIQEIEVFDSIDVVKSIWK